MTHPSELLSALLDGELTGDEEVRIAEHLATCSGCREELDDLNAARTAVRSLPVVEMPPGLGLSGEQPAEVRPLTRRPPVWIAAAA
ncbi:MAG: zf-HC2 domain-containing protein, partial [Acidimicrobiia bacterium]|nr:zf-HC2 domain-containing protein [Acidimicrobiia bacterium]